MLTLEKIQPALFPNLYKSFLIDDDPLSNEQDWRNVFDYRWPKDQDHCGFALLDEGRVVGMLGMVFSQRVINGRQEKFCNLHTWWVREDHRGRSLLLLRPVLKLNDYTITHFTPCDTVRAISKRLGFHQLDSQLKILLPNRLLWASLPSQAADVTYDISEIRSSISDVDDKLLTDHLPYGCNHLWVGDKRRGCYALYTYVVRHRLPYCHIHYVSNGDAFQQFEPIIRTSLLKKHNVRFVAMDARLVKDLDLPFSFNFWAPSHALYKSTRTAPHEIDNLYSDVVFLKLTVLPDMSHALGQLLNRGRTRTRSGETVA